MKGIIRIVITDSTTGLVKTNITKENLITDLFLKRVLGANPTPIIGGFPETTISISESTDNPQFLTTQITVNASGYVPNSVTSPTFNNSVTPPFIQFQNRIDFVGFERTFNTVGLTFSSSANVHDPAVDVDTIAYTKLDTPCIQSEFDIVDIFYRIQFENNGENFINKALYEYAARLVELGTFYIDEVKTYFGNEPPLSYDSLWANESNINTVIYSNTNAGAGWTTVDIIDSHYKVKYSKDFGLDDEVGRIFNGLQHGVSNKINFQSYSYLTGKIVNNTSPFQNLFGHSSSGNKPFFDSLNLPSGTGLVLVSGTPTNKLPLIYKYTIVANGNTGVSKYKFSVRNHLGFVGNTYTDRTIQCIYRHPTLPAAPLMHGYRYEDNDVLRWSSTQIVQYDQTGVTLLDIFDGAYTNWEIATTPSLPVTQARQVSVDPTNQKIYVGCRSTGLWVIDVTANTVTQQLNSPCYGVDVGRNNVAYAIVAGGLYSSDNWSTPLSLSLSNWADVYFLKADPENADDRLGIIINGTSERQVLWWDKVNGSQDGYEGNNYIFPYPASFDVSDMNGYWVTVSNLLLEYGTTNTTYPGDNIPISTMFHSVYGDVDLGKVSFYENNLIAQNNLINLSNQTSITTYSTILGGDIFEPITFVTHLDGGIVLSPTKMRQLFDDNVFPWKNYGWNGSNWTTDDTTWVDGGVGGKLTHSTDQTLINGLQLRFQDVGNPNWISGDNYTQSINYGLLKDNATTLNIKFAWYSAPTVFSAAASGTIPASPPYILELPAANDLTFIRIETDSPELHIFEIAGSPVATVYVSGEAPGVNEVSIDGTTGILTFNSADAGKSFEAVKYAYVKV